MAFVKARDPIEGKDAILINGVKTINGYFEQGTKVKVYETSISGCYIIDEYGNRGFAHFDNIAEYADRE